MNKNPGKIDIVICGGGPIGLYLAGRLIQKGFSCRVIEKNREIYRHSRSLGIHPVSLELFDRAGIVEPFLRDGLKIRKGIAFWNRHPLGEIEFDNCPKPFNYILAIPQWKTESILQDWVLNLDPNALIRGAEVTAIEDSEPSVTTTYKMEDGVQNSIQSRFLAGCDGVSSFVRETLKIPFEGKPYPDSYIMGDFTDNTEFGADAAVYLHEDGLIECFPLPNGMRRWVVKTNQRISDLTPDLLIRVLKNRIGHKLSGSNCEMLSSFGVQHYLAQRMTKGNILLAGDAAHVVSPIGGQGMNLGWLDGEEAVQTIIQSFKNPSDQASLFLSYSKKQRKVAKKVAKRAEMNMWLGRKESSRLPVKWTLALILNTPLSGVLARVFTMRGLGRWWI